MIALLLFPLMFAGLISLAFGNDEEPLPAAKLLIEDHDKGFASRLINSFFASAELRKFVAASPVDESGQASGRERLARGEVSALLVLPEGLSDQLFKGEKVELQLLRNPAQSILPQIAEEICRTLTDVLALGAELYASQQDALGVADLGDFEKLDAAGYGRFGLAAQRLGRLIGPYLDLEDPILAIDTLELDQDGQPKIAAAAAGEGEKKGPSTRTRIFLMILPGVMVYSLFSIGEQMMRDLLFESSHGTLRRQLCAPVTVARLIAAKVLVAGTVAGGGLLLLMGLAMFLLGRLIDPAGFAILSLAVVLAVSGASAAIYGFARTERQGAALANMIYLFLAFLGGSFIPLDSLPAVARKIAPLSPFYWGTRGFQDLLNGEGLMAVLPSIGILLGHRRHPARRRQLPARPPLPTRSPLMKSLGALFRLGWNDVRLTTRDRAAFFWILVLPVGMMWLFGQMGGGQRGPAKASLTLEDHDGGFFAQSLRRELEAASDRIELTVVDLTAGAPPAVPPAAAPAGKPEQPARKLILPAGLSDKLLAHEKQRLRLELGPAASRDLNQNVDAVLRRGLVLRRRPDPDPRGRRQAGGPRRARRQIPGDRRAAAAGRAEGRNGGPRQGRAAGLRPERARDPHHGGDDDDPDLRRRFPGAREGERPPAPADDPAALPRPADRRQDPGAPADRRPADRHPGAGRPLLLRARPRRQQARPGPAAASPTRSRSPACRSWWERSPKRGSRRRPWAGSPACSWPPWAAAGGPPRSCPSGCAAPR